MSNYKEIVTKAIIGKAKKTTKKTYEMISEVEPDNVLGCWVINHTFNGVNNNNKIDINGSFDVNVWYSFDNNTKTQVSTKKFNYNDSLNVHTKETEDKTEVIVRSLKQPTVTDVKIDNDKIILDIEKELGVEVVGNTMIKVPTEDLVDDYEDLTDNNKTKIEETIENINENYLDEDVNLK